MVILAHFLELWSLVSYGTFGSWAFHMVLAMAEAYIFNIEQDFLLDYVQYLDIKIWNKT